ncbi:CBS domain-containing protein [Novosphingobium aerophilum]|uniref:CBS domain-containing protein n=1 Tax=Novosphingobium TaxID=165696 RepID=UPI0012BE852A|nr:MULTISPECIES: CBS domain-containing protein [unclassified Novosphingobium]MPS67464.1 CBS domain-containing protein [Novosphingobium sp.]WRT93267.1 CBS domain-containing protein [Novosphingobium sp. RL4]
MTIGHIIEGRETVLTCQVTCTVSEAAGILADRRIGALPILDGEKLVGIFSERDVIYRLREFGPRMLEMTVGDVMTTPPLTVEPSGSALAALALMTRRRIRHLPVMEGDRMVGFVSIGDIVKYRIDKVESEAAAMRDYIQMA